jgi:hypothetical protein
VNHAPNFLQRINALAHTQQTEMPVQGPRTCFFGSVFNHPFFMHLLKKSAGTSLLFTVGIGLALKDPGTWDWQQGKKDS